MRAEDTPIKRTLTGIMLVISGTVLLLTSGAFLTYEFVTSRHAMIEHLSTLGNLIANNINASLMYDNQQDATEVLSALKAEPHIVAACVYDDDGKVFATFPANRPAAAFPAKPETAGSRFENSRLKTFVPVIGGSKRVGTLYLDSNLGALYDRIQPYAGIVALVTLGLFLVAYLLSNVLQARISQPIFALAETAKAISVRNDYSVRAPGRGTNELGVLTEAFNNMLEQIHQRDRALQQAQQELKEHAGQLEEKVKERTARLSETIAELESFSYSISHDMRAPLRAMQGYSSYVTKTYGEKLGKEGQDFLERINRAGRRLDNLVQDILTYSRLSRAQLEMGPVDVDKLVTDIIEQYPGLQAPQSEVIIQRPLGRVAGHEASLTQVLSNLLGNAVKFTVPGRKAMITIRTEERGVDCRIWIEDNGIGIAAKDLTRIFGIFERVHPDKTYEGTGIGLSIVRKAVERMGGQTGVESEPGKGSRFWIQLKRV